MTSLGRIGSKVLSPSNQSSSLAKSGTPGSGSGSALKTPRLDAGSAEGPRKQVTFGTKSEAGMQFSPAGAMTGSMVKKKSRRIQKVTQCKLSGCGSILKICCRIMRILSVSASKPDWQFLSIATVLVFTMLVWYVWLSIMFAEPHCSWNTCQLSASYYQFFLPLNIAFMCRSMRTRALGGRGLLCASVKPS